MKLKEVNKQLINVNFWYYLGYASGPSWGSLYSDKIYRPIKLITYKKLDSSDLINYLMYENLILTCAPCNYIIVEIL